MITKELLFYASAGGILPALLWLWFWLKEDSKNPEPRRLLALTFAVGMLSVIPTILLQFFVEKNLVPIFKTLADNLGILVFLASSLTILVINAFIEEILKFGAAFFTAIRTKNDNEPIDPVIYLITTALGFVAVENTLFIMSSYLESSVGKELISSFIVGNVRFIGASLIHVGASAIIGVFLALTFKKKMSTKILFTFFGIIIATALHSYSNFLIMKGGVGFLFSFPLIWSVIVVLIFLLEKIKRIKI